MPPRRLICKLYKAWLGISSRCLACAAWVRANRARQCGCHPALDGTATPFIVSNLTASQPAIITRVSAFEAGELAQPGGQRGQLVAQRNSCRRPVSWASSAGSAVSPRLLRSSVCVAVDRASLMRRRACWGVGNNGARNSVRPSSLLNTPAGMTHTAPAAGDAGTGCTPYRTGCRFRRVGSVQRRTGPRSARTRAAYCGASVPGSPGPARLPGAAVRPAGQGGQPPRRGRPCGRRGPVHRRRQRSAARLRPPGAGRPSPAPGRGNRRRDAG